MANSYFQFKQFTVHQEHCAMKVTTDACLFGAWAALQWKEMLHDAISHSPAALDVGTGTGLLSLMLAQKTRCVIDALEIDQLAHQQSKENFNASPWPERINAIYGDAREFYFLNKYDLVISNPPFYENELRSPVRATNRARHDESLLLPELLALIEKTLKPAGRFYLLLPFKRKEEIIEHVNKTGLRILHKAFMKQTISHEPFRLMLSGSVGQEEEAGKTNEEIIIKDEKGAYTPGFVNYLREYYLHL